MRDFDNPAMLPVTQEARIELIARTFALPRSEARVIVNQMDRVTEGANDPDAVLDTMLAIGQRIDAAIRVGSVYGEGDEPGTAAFYLTELEGDQVTLVYDFVERRFFLETTGAASIRIQARRDARQVQRNTTTSTPPVATARTEEEWRALISATWPRARQIDAAVLAEKLHIAWRTALGDDALQEVRVAARTLLDAIPGSLGGERVDGRQTLTWAWRYQERLPALQSLALYYAPLVDPFFFVATVEAGDAGHVPPRVGQAVRLRVDPVAPPFVLEPTRGEAEMKRAAQTNESPLIAVYINPKTFELIEGVYVARNNYGIRHPGSGASGITIGENYAEPGGTGGPNRQYRRVHSPNALASERRGKGYGLLLYCTATLAARLDDLRTYERLRKSHQILGVYSPCCHAIGSGRSKLADALWASMRKSGVAQIHDLEPRYEVWTHLRTDVCVPQGPPGKPPPVQEFPTRWPSRAPQKKDKACVEVDVEAQFPQDAQDYIDYRTVLDEPFVVAFAGADTKSPSPDFIVRAKIVSTDGAGKMVAYLREFYDEDLAQRFLARADVRELLYGQRRLPGVDGFAGDDSTREWTMPSALDDVGDQVWVGYDFNMEKQVEVDFEAVRDGAEDLPLPPLSAESLDLLERFKDAE